MLPSRGVGRDIESLSAGNIESNGMIKVNVDLKIVIFFSLSLIFL
jgi:hypothetical protein